MGTRQLWENYLARGIDMSEGTGLRLIRIQELQRRMLLFWLF